SGYPKVWFELQALAWNRPALRARVARVNAEWRAVLTEAFAAAMKDYGVDDDRWPVEALVSLVMTFNQGIEVERLTGVSAGHHELLAAVDRFLVELERQKAKRQRHGRPRNTRRSSRRP